MPGDWSHAAVLPGHVWALLKAYMDELVFFSGKFIPAFELADKKIYEKRGATDQNHGAPGNNSPLDAFDPFVPDADSEMGRLWNFIGAPLGRANDALTIMMHRNPFSNGNPPNSQGKGPTLDGSLLLSRWHRQLRESMTADVLAYLDQEVGIHEGPMTYKASFELVTNRWNAFDTAVGQLMQVVSCVPATSGVVATPSVSGMSVQESDFSQSSEGTGASTVHGISRSWTMPLSATNALGPISGTSTRFAHDDNTPQQDPIEEADRAEYLAEMAEILTQRLLQVQQDAGGQRDISIGVARTLSSSGSIEAQTPDSIGFARTRTEESVFDFDKVMATWD